MHVPIYTSKQMSTQNFIPLSQDTFAVLLENNEFCSVLAGSREETSTSGSQVGRLKMQTISGVVVHN